MDRRPFASESQRQATESCSDCKRSSLTVFDSYTQRVFEAFGQYGDLAHKGAHR